MLLDMRLLAATAKLVSQLPALKEFRLEESVRQFRVPLEEQLDLEYEAANMSRFTANFAWHAGVRFPRILYPLVSREVLVETFEDGQLLAEYAKTGSLSGRR